MTVAPLTRERRWRAARDRRELEGLAARSAAGLTESQRETLAKELAGLNAEFRRAASAKGAPARKLYELDEKFHRRYVEAGAGRDCGRCTTPWKPQAERYIRIVHRPAARHGADGWDRTTM